MGCFGGCQFKVGRQAPNSSVRAGVALHGCSEGVDDVGV